MRVTVMKFGGTSVADPEKILRAADRVVAARRKGLAVAVVVSAPGEMTDELLALARRVSPRPEPRELDQLLATGEQVSIALLAMAFRARKVPALSLTGPQAGIEARGPHTSAEISRIRPAKVLKELSRGRVAVIAGFQGRDPQGDVATLGRGGSDLTAVAVAAALKAESCEIFTDVKGVYTADPRLVPQARKLSQISFEDMLALAKAGAQVMQARSLQVARRHNLPLHIRSAFHPQPGTWVLPRQSLKRPAGKVTALALEKNGRRARIALVGRGLSRHVHVPAENAEAELRSLHRAYLGSPG